MNVKSAITLILFVAIFRYSIAENFSKADYSCTKRYEMADAIRRENVCFAITTLHKVCSQDLIVTFSESHPYIFAEKVNGETKVHGYLSGEQGFRFSGSSEREQKEMSWGREKHSPFQFGLVLFQNKISPAD